MEASDGTEAAEVNTETPAEADGPPAQRWISRTKARTALLVGLVVLIVVVIVATRSKGPTEGPLAAYARLRDNARRGDSVALFAELDPKSQQFIRTLNQTMHRAAARYTRHDNPYIAADAAATAGQTDAQALKQLLAANNSLWRLLRQDVINVTQVDRKQAVLEGTDPGAETGRPLRIVLVAANGQWRLSLVESDWRLGGN